MTEDPFRSAEWAEFVRFTREHTVKQIESSALVMQIVPDAASVDVKVAVELGVSILLDKPLVLMQLPGRPIPPKLRAIADEIVEADLDTEDGRQQLQAALERVRKR